MNLRSLICRATGMMSKKQIVRTCNQIGIEIADSVKKDGKVTSEAVQNILTKYIGQKRANEVVISTDKSVFINFAEKIGLERKTAEYFWLNSKSAVVPAKDNKILLSLRLDGMSTPEMVNTTTHELEHVLFQKISPVAKFDNFVRKVVGQKFVDKVQEKYGEIINSSNIKLNQSLLMELNLPHGAANCGISQYNNSLEGLMKQMRYLSKEDFSAFLNNVTRDIEKYDSKTNRICLKNLKHILQDESRAYGVGGNAERYFNKISGISNPNATYSDLASMLFKETSRICKKEARNQLWMMLKEKFSTFFKCKSEVQNVV